MLFACGDSEPTDKIYFDADSDGFTSETDCDDPDARINPEAEEVCDGIDNDCDDLIDDEDNSAVLTVFYIDSDGDGFGGQI